VLPFNDLSGHDANRPFTDGLHDDPGRRRWAGALRTQQDGWHHADTVPAPVSRLARGDDNGVEQIIAAPIVAGILKWL
jgi:hypothetical protein